MHSKQVISGKDLKVMRMRAYLTQHHLAARAGIHVQTVRYWESKPVVKGHAPNRMLLALEIKGIRHGQAYAPVECNGKCGAKTRAGTACKRSPAPNAKRCRLHGGLSTGPKTPEGREAIRQAQLRRWERFRAAATRI